MSITFESALQKRDNLVAFKLLAAGKVDADYAIESAIKVCRPRGKLCELFT